MCVSFDGSDRFPAKCRTCCVSLSLERHQPQPLLTRSSILISVASEKPFLLQNDRISIQIWIARFQFSIQFRFKLSLTLNWFQFGPFQSKAKKMLVACLVCLLFVRMQGASSFNIDTVHPLVYEDPDADPSQRGSYFGYSVQFLFTESSGQRPTKW